MRRKGGKERVAYKSGQEPGQTDMVARVSVGFFARHWPLHCLPLETEPDFPWSLITGLTCTTGNGLCLPTGT